MPVGDVLKALAFLIAWMIFFVGQAAQAETLQQALVRTYTSNPTLQKQQARLRAVDEQVPLSKSGAHPTADFNANGGAESVDVAGQQTNLKPRGLGFSVTQPIYKGGTIDSSISAAESAVLAQRALLHDTEQNVLLSAVTAYLNVARDQSVLKINLKNEQVLREELQAARDRLRVGEATRTDVSQAEARHARAVADRIQAEGNLSLSKATYEQVIGVAPSELEIPHTDYTPPAQYDDFIKLAEASFPQVVAAKYQEIAAGHDIDTASGALLPQISVTASADRDWDQSIALKQKTDTAQVMATLTIPLYHAGADYARTRSAKQTASQRRVEVMEAMRAAQQNAVRTWQAFKTAEASIVARKKEVDAAELAYQGFKQEAAVGTRTVIDRLNAEADALQAQVNLVTTARDFEVAKYDMRAAVGDLTAAKLALPVPYYNPEDHYEEVKDAWIGLGDNVEVAPDVQTPADKADPTTVTGKP